MLRPRDSRPLDTRPIVEPIMCLATRCVLLLALLLRSPLPGLAAQELSADAFGQALGEVRSANGELWRGATVTLLARPVRTNPFVGEPHRVVVRSDANGRFRASVRISLVYSVWAHGDAEGGVMRATEVVERVVAQQPVLLREQRQPVALRTVRFSGLERWRQFAPLEFELVDRIGNRRLLGLEVDAHGQARLPLLLGELVEFRVLGSGRLGRRLLFWIEVPRREILPATAAHAAAADGGSGASTAAAAPGFVIELPAPTEMRFSVRDRATGKPLSGATIYQSNQLGLTWPVARTGADGTVTTPLHDEGFCFARAADHAVGFFPPSRPRGNLMQCAMQAGRSLHGQIHRRPGEPLADATLLVMSAASDPGQTSFLPDVLRTDAAGRFVIEGVHAAMPPMVKLVLAPAQLAGLPPAWHSLHPVVPLDIAARMTDRPVATFVLMSPDMCPVHLRFQNPDRTPASLAELRLRSDDPSVVFYPKFCWLTDRQGSCRLLLPAARRLGLAVRGADGMLLAGLVMRRVTTDPRPAELLVTIPHSPIVRGRVVDAAGAAVAAAPVLMAVNLLPQPSVESTAEPLPGSGNAAGLVPFAALDPGLLRLLADYWIHPSGPDGRFRFPVPMLPHDCLLSVHYRVRPGYGSARLRVEPDATAPDPPAVEIRLRSLR